MCSYLSDRKQYVECNGAASEYLTVKCGVPQGSILDPLLFFLYINDIHLSSSLLKFILFADDTNVLFSNADFNVLQDILNSELEKVSNWLMANKLTVNIKKTNYIIFKVRQKQLPSVPFNIRINNETIERKSHTKFLGVHVDENLNWKEPVNLRGPDCKYRESADSCEISQFILFYLKDLFGELFSKMEKKVP